MLELSLLVEQRGFDLRLIYADDETMKEKIFKCSTERKGEVSMLVMEKKIDAMR